MKLKAIRRHYTAKSTISDLYVNDVFFCHVLEDVCRDANRDGDLDDAGEAKVYGKTAIPAGRYPVIISFSNRFKRMMPEILHVPGFSGIRIHNGNTADHTDGCLLVGRRMPDLADFVADSRVTFSKLMSKLETVAKLEKISIEIVDTILQETQGDIESNLNSDLNQTQTHAKQ